MQTPATQNIRKYQIISDLGRGATSVVYRRYDPFAKRYVAVKVFNHDGFTSNEERKKFTKLFLTEASIVGKINHPHIVAVYDAVIDGEADYIVMELVNGAALDAHGQASTLLPI